MSKLEKVLDNTLDVSEATIQDRFTKFQESEKGADKGARTSQENIFYLSSIGT